MNQINLRCKTAPGIHFGAGYVRLCREVQPCSLADCSKTKHTHSITTYDSSAACSVESSRDRTLLYSKDGAVCKPLRPAVMCRSRIALSSLLYELDYI